MASRAEYLRQWRAAYPWKTKMYNDSRADYMRQWRAAHPEKVAASNARRRKAPVQEPPALASWPCCGMGPCTGLCERKESCGGEP